MMPTCSGASCHNTTNTNYERTDFFPQVPGTSNTPSYTGVVATEEVFPYISDDGYTGNSSSSGARDSGDGGNTGSNNGFNASSIGLTGVRSGSTTARAVAGAPAGSLPSQEEIFQNSPLFSVPSNPLAPPGYETTLDYGSLQYMNGFLRTQIGKYVRIQHLLGSNVIEDRYGYLVGVGVNYVLLQEISTGNILVLDFYNIKYVYIYYTNPDLPQNEIR